MRRKEVEGGRDKNHATLGPPKGFSFLLLVFVILVLPVLFFFFFFLGLNGGCSPRESFPLSLSFSPFYPVVFLFLNPSGVFELGSQPPFTVLGRSSVLPGVCVNKWPSFSLKIK
jgi:hypothetical protein